MSKVRAVGNPDDKASEAAQPRPPGSGVARLSTIMARLRSPDGCPWDREQDLLSLKPHLLEETYELLETMDGTDPAAHAEELGDVLLQVVFQARIREEQGQFSLDDVAHVLSDKLVRRHPHVFGDVQVDDSAAVLRNWEAIKRTEKKPSADGPRSALDGVPKALPALARAQRMQSKASRCGFDWPDVAGVEAKLTEELAELAAARQTNDAAAVRHEIGDLLFSVVNLCRFLKVDAEDALQEASSRFARRFREVERRATADGRDMRDCTLAELDVYWDAAKQMEKR
ncbi:MAG: nucleoside triphosphate pyrophosphohydrolase [bacterium]